MTRSHQCSCGKSFTKPQGLGLHFRHMRDDPGHREAGTDQVINEQPTPVANDRPAVWSLVLTDMVQRDKLGRERYGTPLQPHNGRDALLDAYQEALDLCVYLRQAIFERDGR